MKLKTFLLGFILGLLPITAIAGSDHDHGHGHSHSTTPVDKATAITTATSIVAEFVKRKKQEESWGSITSSSDEKKGIKKNKKWVVSF